MIQVKEAIRRIHENTTVLGVEERVLEDATGYVLAVSVTAPVSFPPFDQSAMDGYAIGDLNSDNFLLVSELKAGDSGKGVRLETGQACRVFTGAMLPAGTTAVVKQEDVNTENGRIFPIKGKLLSGENIRPFGEQIRQGEEAVPAFTVLNPGTIGYLAMLGIVSVKVFRKPKIAIVATGNELVVRGSELQPGQIYESNTITLKSALKHAGFDADTECVPDVFEKIKEHLDHVIQVYDLVLVTGGISVGDYDFVGKALNKLGVEEHFYKVRQKPGKPIYFGKKEQTVIFGLPGNPAAVLTSFYLYVTEVLSRMTGNREGFLRFKQLRLLQEVEKTSGLTWFLKGKIEENGVRILPAQSSGMLSAFVEADCLVELPEGESLFPVSCEVKVIMIR